MNNWMEIADRVLDGGKITNDEALSILDCPDDDVILLMHAAFQIRKHHYGKKVKLNMIMNAKSGLCPENCGYCAQSIVSKAPIESYQFVDKETIFNSCTPSNCVPSMACRKLTGIGASLAAK